VGGRTTGNLIALLSFVNFELTQLAAGADRTNKIFEKRAVEQELKTRQAMVHVKVVRTEDSVGADEVYVKMAAGGRSYKSPVRDLNDGQEWSFRIPLSELVPIQGPIAIEVYDEDLVYDDLIAKLTLSSPFAPVVNDRSLGGADYRVRASLDR
jgi:hypothetical protein